MSRLKKFNAFLGLLSTPLLLIHIGYSVYCYLTFYYNPTLKMVLALPMIVVICLHAICGMISVFTVSDGTRLNLYPKQNRKTVIQRVSAALIFPLLLLHLRTYDQLRSAASTGNWVWFAVVIVLQVLFYATAILHMSVSFSRGLVTIGWLSSPKKQQMVDRIALICGAVVFVVAVFGVVKGEINMIPMFQGAKP